MQRYVFTSTKIHFSTKFIIHQNSFKHLVQVLLLCELRVPVLPLPLPGDGADASCLDGGLALQADREQLPLVTHGGEDAAVLIEYLVNRLYPLLTQTCNRGVTYKIRYDI